MTLDFTVYFPFFGEIVLWFVLLALLWVLPFQTFLWSVIWRLFLVAIFQFFLRKIVLWITLCVLLLTLFSAHFNSALLLRSNFIKFFTLLRSIVLHCAPLHIFMCRLFTCATKINHSICFILRSFALLCAPLRSNYDFLFNFSYCLQSVVTSALPIPTITYFHFALLCAKLRSIALQLWFSI